MNLMFDVLSGNDIQLQSGSVNELTGRIDLCFLHSDDEMPHIRERVRELAKAHITNNPNKWSGIFPHDADINAAVNSMVLYGSGPPQFIPVEDLPIQDENLPQLVLVNYSRTSLTFQWRNDTGKDNFYYGEPFNFYVREGDSWRHLNAGMMFVMPAYGIPAYGTTEQRHVNIGSLHGRGRNLPPGEYKFTKGFHYFRGTGDFDKYTSEVRFVIE
jgi:hypothetical protein